MSITHPGGLPLEASDRVHGQLAAWFPQPVEPAQRVEASRPQRGRRRAPVARPTLAGLFAQGTGRRVAGRSL